MSHRGRRPAKELIRETHEPDTPIDWPDGHVGAELTEDDVEECIAVRIHGVKHYLHLTTARELSDMLVAKLDEWNAKAVQAGHRPV